MFTGGFCPSPVQLFCAKKVLGFLARFPMVPAVWWEFLLWSLTRLWIEFVLILLPSLVHWPHSAACCRKLHLWTSGVVNTHKFRQYSCHSSTYQSLSRIDLMIGNSLAHNLITKVEYLTWGILDNSPMLLVLRIPGGELVGVESKFHCWSTSLVEVGLGKWMGHLL